MARISSVCTCEILKYPTCVCRLIHQVYPSTCARLAVVISKSEVNAFIFEPLRLNLLKFYRPLVTGIHHAV